MPVKTRHFPILQFGPLQTKMLKMLKMRIFRDFPDQGLRKSAAQKRRKFGDRTAKSF